MPDHTCAGCGAITSPHDVVSVAAPDGAYRLLCSRCFNIEMARLADVHAFEHPEFTPIRLPGADGVVHEFHFRSLLFGDQLSLEALELASGDEDREGFRFQILGDPQTDPFELLGQMVKKIRRALAISHVVERAGQLELAGTMVRGRIEWDENQHGRLPCVVIDGRRIAWDDFGEMLMMYEGWQFRLELIDPSEEA
ncbi:DUF7713 domain-containing protein [Paraburkholderia strydomiana]|uniref:DUF7713 domain-containing protein n=1 Tax=Paraburkholderia strydomiana TaxID=1245417 RepID=UPI001BE68E48|nr:hypothetical protein [Paraburkholderia strydomiana]MBT2792839.1 hypothetical protein [Paraburkholderia strydomiana]